VIVVLQEVQEHRELAVLQEHRELAEVQEHRVHLVLLEHQEEVERVDMFFI
jgi:hypothetical protein